MSVTVGPTICGTGADGGGAKTWTNPGNITANDASLATCALGVGGTSNELLATNFSESIPVGASLVSIQVDVQRIRG